jgi:L-serine dehydratase
MRAARRFAILAQQCESQVERVLVELYGSLGHTGRGHGSDVAILLGLEGELPETVDTDTIGSRKDLVLSSGQLNLLGARKIEYRQSTDLIFHRKKTLPGHVNGMKFSAFDVDDKLLLEKNYYSVGGGFIVTEETDAKKLQDKHSQLPWDFQSGDEMLAMATESGLSISGLMLENEKLWRPEAEVFDRLDSLWMTMTESINKGMHTEGILPGILKVKRRAPGLRRKLASRGVSQDPLSAMDWVNLFALSVNEENAAGGRIVTAPTNGAAGIIPAVIKYYEQFYEPAGMENIRRFFLTAAAIGILYKLNASLSGAEVGCQGEVGVACSMAAAGLTEALGGSPAQVECAAEIGMEHNLGLTCDPVGGLVQVPCIERNAMGAVKAINAAKLALQGDGDHKVSLDKVIKTMRETGADMKTKYKETSRGGLAVNIIEC